MIGNQRLPCGHENSKKRFPKDANGEYIPGLYEKQCSVCNQQFTAVIEISDYASERCGRPTMSIKWWD